MPNPAAGVFKQLAYKAETTFGTIATQASGQSLRRVQSTIDLTKDTYSSNEIRADFQVADFRHGVRRVAGKISGELSPKTYAEFMAAALKKDFATGVAAATLTSVTIGSPTGSVYPFSRVGGSFLTEGFKVGDIIKITAGTFNAANLTKNLMITAIASATAASVIVVNGSALVAEGPISAGAPAFSVVGKKSWVPLTAHTDKSFSIEHWYSDLVQSEVFLGCKPDKIAIALPPTGMATIDIDIMGQDFADTTAKRGAIATTAQYFTSPTAATTTGSLAAVNGLLRVGGVAVGTITGLSVEIDPAYSGDPAVGSNIVPFLFAGPVKVSGQFTAYFDSVTLRDSFVNETEVDILSVFTADNTAAADFLAITLPRVKVGGAAKNDGSAGLVQTFPFTALLNNAGGTGISTEKTTVSIQDSQA